MSNENDLDAFASLLASARSSFADELATQLQSLLPDADIFGFALECSGDPSNMGVISTVGRRSRVENPADPLERFSMENWEYIPNGRTFGKTCDVLAALSEKIVSECEALDAEASEEFSTRARDAAYDMFLDVTRRLGEEGAIKGVEVCFLFIPEDDSDNRRCDPC
jgi:hypothetical protein